MKFPQIVQEHDKVFPRHPVFHRGKGRHNFAATISRDDACHLMPAGAKRKLGMQCKRLPPSYAQLIVNAKARMTLPDMLSLHANLC